MHRPYQKKISKNIYISVILKAPKAIPRSTPYDHSFISFVLLNYVYLLPNVLFVEQASCLNNSRQTTNLSKILTTCPSK